MSRLQTGHVRQRKSGLWEGQYVYQKERRSIYGGTQEEVSQQLDEIIASIENGNYIRPNQHTLISWLREWLHTYAKPTLRPATFTSYGVNIERHFNTELGKVRLKNVSTRMLQDFFNEKSVSGRADKKRGGLSPKTLKNMRYMDIITVSEILGHAKPSPTLDMYGHTFYDRKRALMEQM